MAFFFQHRWLIVKRQDPMSQPERAELATLFSYLPELKTRRAFVDRLERLLEEDPSASLAWGRQAALRRSGAFLAVPELARALGRLEAEKFAKMIAFLKSLACRRVGTNNHVERINRTRRHPEKARYQGRKRRRIVRFVVRLLDRWWRQERAMRRCWCEPPEEQPTRSSSKPPPRRRVA